MSGRQTWALADEFFNEVEDEEEFIATSKGRYHPSG